MSRKMKISLLLVAGALLASVSTAQAASITCPTSGSYSRTGTLDSALSCVSWAGQTGTPNAGDVALAVPPGPWTNEGSIAGTSGTTGTLSDDWLTLTVNSGSWGSIPAGGTWQINPLFWGTYGRAAITFHLGGGNRTNPNQDPDFWFFEIATGATSGTWSFAALPNNSGGGLSNGNLWGSGTPNQGCTGPNCNPVVPEPATLLLLGTGLAALAVRLRRKSAS